jgi:beta-galactosidase
MANYRTFINFEAVDNTATVWVNGVLVGRHVGGFAPFQVEVTGALLSSQQSGDDDHEVVVRVLDSTDGAQPRGKQSRSPSGIWYSPVSGIWQSVWIEVVPQAHFTTLPFKSYQASNSSWYLSVAPSVSTSWKEDNSEALRYNIGVLTTGKGSFVAEGSGAVAKFNAVPSDVHLHIPNPQLWSPKTPYLYEIVATLELVTTEGKVEFSDVVHSYAALRKVGRIVDRRGDLRFTLNGEAVFHLGTLDQGWWPDGLLTPPSDVAQLSDLHYLKAAGFNTVRKHAKVENRRYYYHCDRLGLMVWQDHVSSDTPPARHRTGRLSPRWVGLGTTAQIGSGKVGTTAVWVGGKTRGTGHWLHDLKPREGNWSSSEHSQFMVELGEMVTALESHPSIVVWVPFNEAWGQHQTLEVGKWMEQRDPSRLLNVASGGNFWPVGDIVDHHNYPAPYFPRASKSSRLLSSKTRSYPGYVKVVGEFGGHGLAVDGHVYFNSTNDKKKSWGYGKLKGDSTQLLYLYQKSTANLNMLIKKGIAGSIYTQVSPSRSSIVAVSAHLNNFLFFPFCFSDE